MGELNGGDSASAIDVDPSLCATGLAKSSVLSVLLMR